MAEQVLDCSNIRREIRNLVSRRREMMIFLGSLFAAMALYLQNVLDGKLPGSLATLEQSAFLTHSIAVLLPTLVIALRIAKLHSGMVINGVFYSHILRQTYQPTRDPVRSARLNWAGVTTQIFLIANLIAGFESALLALALGRDYRIALVAGVTVFTWLLYLFVRFHGKAARFALQRIETATVEPFDREEIEDHLAGSLEDCNHDMLAITSFVGLMLFSVFESLSGLGGIAADETEIASADVQLHGPVIYSLLLFLITLMGLVTYLRLAVSIGNFSLELDPTDRPFKAFRLTDSFLGYALLAFFLAVATHLLYYPILSSMESISWIVDGAVLAVTLAAYQVTMLVCAWRVRKSG